MYGLVLAARGFRVLEAEGAADALSHLAACLPDIIVAEVSIPQADAIDLLLRLRAEPRTSRIPVIVLTAWTDLATRERATGAGASAVMIKPCLPDALAQMIWRVLDNVKGMQS